VPASAVVNDDLRHRAWDDIHDLLPAGWQAGPTSYDPGRRRWTVVARGPNSGIRTRSPATISGQGEEEIAALTELVLALRELNRPGQMADLERRARLAYLSGAEEQSQADHDRGLTESELERVVRRYPAEQG